MLHSLYCCNRLDSIKYHTHFPVDIDSLFGQTMFKSLSLDFLNVRVFTSMWIVCCFMFIIDDLLLGYIVRVAVCLVIESCTLSDAVYVKSRTIGSNPRLG